MCKDVILYCDSDKWPHDITAKGITRFQKTLSVVRTKCCAANNAQHACASMEESAQVCAHMQDSAYFYTYAHTQKYVKQCANSCTKL